MEKYNSNIKLGTVTLNVVNLEKQIKFYTDGINIKQCPRSYSRY